MDWGFVFKEIINMSFPDSVGQGNIAQYEFKKAAEYTKHMMPTPQYVWNFIRESTDGKVIRSTLQRQFNDGNLLHWNGKECEQWEEHWEEIQDFKKKVLLND